ncbi:efflux RND transporter permease subunit [Microbulbifer halophilus]|uniref:Efflux RND transporter permease subunit n=1 Tax=Microbulbifer halophilus TaxID=453963 RepID=A0ABW5EHF7_9GAMM|nr:efflux RND transporter permease subunit [Microbulbifer halophilus]MCW8126338.1 efflux RND transporter permease subunit [Microbulbifer halophilus]
MNLAQLAYRYRRLVFEDSEITIREAVISTAFLGLPAEEVEEKITKPLEEHVRALGEVENIRSTSMRGRSLIHVEIRDRYFDLDQIWDEVREQIDAAQSELPEGTGTPVLNDDFGDLSVVTAALTADDFSQVERLQMAEHIRATLRRRGHPARAAAAYPRRPAAGPFGRAGALPRRIGRSVAGVQYMPPAGVLETAEQLLALQVSGEYRSLDELRRAEIRLPGDGGTLRLSDPGQIKRGYREPMVQTAYFNGRWAIVSAVSMQDDCSVLGLWPGALSPFPERCRRRQQSVRPPVSLHGAGL